MTKRPALLVPVQLEALVIPPGPGLTVPMKGAEADDEPFSASTTLGPGVHLHWALPDGLSIGEPVREPPPADGTVAKVIDYALPTVPDAWMVVRFNRPDSAGSPRTWKAWVVDAWGARVADWDSASFRFRDGGGTFDGSPVRAVADGDWRLTARGVLYKGLLKATAKRNKDESLAPRLVEPAYYPSCGKRLGFHDTDILTSSGPVSYLVMGWYTRPDAEDPLRTAGNDVLTDDLDRFEYLLGRDWDCHAPGDTLLRKNEELATLLAERRAALIDDVEGLESMPGKWASRTDSSGGTRFVGARPTDPVFSTHPVEPDDGVAFRGPAVTGESDHIRAPDVRGSDSGLWREMVTRVWMPDHIVCHGMVVEVPWAGSLFARAKVYSTDARPEPNDVKTGVHPSLAGAAGWLAPPGMNIASMLVFLRQGRDLGSALKLLDVKHAIHAAGFDGALGEGDKGANARWFQPSAPVLRLSDIGRAWRFGYDGRCDLDGKLVCRTSDQAVKAMRLRQAFRLAGAPQFEITLHFRDGSTGATGVSVAIKGERVRGVSLECRVLWSVGPGGVPKSSLWAKEGTPAEVPPGWVVSGVSFRLAGSDKESFSLVASATFARIGVLEGVSEDGGVTLACVERRDAAWRSSGTMDTWDRWRASWGRLRTLSEWDRTAASEVVDPVWMSGITLQTYATAGGFGADARTGFWIDVGADRVQTVGDGSTPISEVAFSRSLLAPTTDPLTAGLPAALTSALFDAVLVDPLSVRTIGAAYDAAVATCSPPGGYVRAEMDAPAERAKRGGGFYEQGWRGTEPSPVAVRPWRQPWGPIWVESRWSFIGGKSESPTLDDVDISDTDIEFTPEPLWWNERAPLSAAVPDVLADVDATVDVDMLTCSAQKFLTRLVAAGLTPDLVAAPVLGVTWWRVVDTFGRTVERIAASGSTLATTELPPRLQAWSRIHARFCGADWTSDATPVAKDDPKNEKAPHTTSNPKYPLLPVCGYLIADHVEAALEFHSAEGISLGQIRSSGGSVRWEPSPNGVRIDQIPDPDLAAIAAALMESNTVIKKKGSVPTRLKSLLLLIDSTRYAIDRWNRTKTYRSVLVGRPIAVVRARVWLETHAPGPTPRLSIAGATKPTPTNLEVRIGSVIHGNDGVLGCFRRGTATQVFPADLGNANLASAGNIDKDYVSSKGIGLPVTDDPARDLLLLIDGASVATFVTGIQPRKQILFDDRFAPRMAHLDPSFAVGPVLVDPAKLRLPTPKIEGATWLWQVNGAAKPSPVTAATDAAFIPDVAASVVRGTLIMDVEPVFTGKGK